MSSESKWEHQEAFELYLAGQRKINSKDIYSDDFQWLIKVMKKDAFKAGIEYGRKLNKKRRLRKKYTDEEVNDIEDWASTKVDAPTDKEVFIETIEETGERDGKN